MRNLPSCSELNAVLGRLSSGFASPLFFFTFLILGPELGRSEYLVQKTQAGHN